MSAKRKGMLRFDVCWVMWDLIGAKNGEREREREREKMKRIGNDIKRESVCVCEKDEMGV